MAKKASFAIFAKFSYLSCHPIPYFLIHLEMHFYSASNGANCTRLYDQEY